MGDFSDAVKNIEKNFSRVASRARNLVEYLNSNITESFAAMVHQTLNGRRVNNVLIFHRQVLMAGLIYAAGYSRHAELLMLMGVAPTESLQQLEGKVEVKRNRDRARTGKRIHPRPAAKDTGYKKQTFAEPDLLKLVEQNILSQVYDISHVDIALATSFTNFDLSEFMEYTRYRLMSTTAADILFKHNPVLDNAKIHFSKRIECMEKLVF
jgi:hypothetical protein